MQRDYIPPGGVIGAQSNTLAAQAALIGSSRSTSSSGTGRRRRASTRSTSKPRKRKSSYKSNGRMKKGSAAAKAWGRKMKRARRR